MAVASDDAHRFSKPVRESIRLIEGLGVDGDTHAGALMQHRSRQRGADTPPNIRQVHLIHRELFDFVAARGHTVGPGNLGENVTTEGIDLLALPEGTLLHLGDEAIIEVTGLRNPCIQINGFSEGLMKELVHRDEAGNVVRLAGIMSVVRRGGTVRAGDPITSELPAAPHVALGPV